MRIAVALLVVAAACHQPSLKDRALGFGHKVVAVANRIDASISPDAKAQIKGFVVAQAQAKVDQIVAAHLPAAPMPTEVADADADASAGDDDAQAAPEQPAMVPATLVVHEHHVAAASTFVARYKTANGAWTCSKHSTMEACSASCTQVARQAMTARTDAQCSCLEDAACP